MLSTLRFPVHASRGRRYPEPPHPYRNDFQRDRDRVIHARAFRRLEAKTQVFAPNLCDHFRNRLTHTIEVAQIARTAAAALCLNEDLTEALALAHDIGHPPYAHAGEEELNLQMQRFGERFDHNLHALRIVESFEQRYIRFSGLNLTFEVREGIVKHSRDLPAEVDAELADYLPGQHPPLEAQLIDLADEAAYNTADLDDGWSANLLEAADIAAAVPVFAEILDTIESQYPGASQREQFQEALRAMVDTLVSGLIEGTRAAVEESGVDSVEEIRLYPRRLAAMTAEAAEANAQAKALLHASVYNSKELLAERELSRARVAALFELLLAEPGRMPVPYQEASHERPLHRVVCEYIAGMTDGYLRRTYDACFSPRD